ncbi:YdcF family protein [Rickettsia endosymbiont of Halotydeus destructor]|uniref:YdcF family protein n=1 Tax=Rickettsia endosymbiont of Halotydeus destructor TaxID=2996754 RepID=UPI003BAF797E
MMRNMLLAILTIFVMWVGGFAYYFYTINSYKTNNTITNGIAVFAGGGRRIETAIALLKAGYAPILFITGITSQDQLRNLLKENEVREEQVIYAPNNIMSEEDYAKKTTDFIVANNLTSLRLVTSAYNMPIALKELTKAMPLNRQVYVIPHSVGSTSISGQYKILFKSYNQYLMSIF